METRKKITPEQLQALFDFVQRKRVRYYDLQVELVDHFASAIEDLWRENPELPFGSAINKVYDGFPITGFSSVIDKKSEAVQREAWWWVFKIWTTYFRWPRILMSVVVLLAVRLLFFLPVSASWLFWGTGAVIIATWSWTLYKMKADSKKLGKRFLRLEATYVVVGMFLNFFNSIFIVAYSTVFEDLNTFPVWGAWLMAFFLTYFGFLLYILFYQLPRRALEDLRLHFPKYA